MPAPQSKLHLFNEKLQHYALFAIKIVYVSLHEGICATCHTFLAHLVHLLNNIPLMGAKPPLPHVLTCQY